MEYYVVVLKTTKKKKKREKKAWSKMNKNKKKLWSLLRYEIKINIVTIIAFCNFFSSSSFEGHPLQVRHKQEWGRGFILLLPPDCCTA